MSEVAASDALDNLMDSLSDCLNADAARRLVEFRVDPRVQTRVDDLAERANEGILTDEERSEYEALIEAADFIAILKIKARRKLEGNHHT